jgi:hypothetical protein
MYRTCILRKMTAWTVGGQPCMLATKNNGKTFGPMGRPGQILCNRVEEM